MRRCADAPMRRCADAPMRRCADAPMRRAGQSVPPESFCRLDAFSGQTNTFGGIVKQNVGFADRVARGIGALAMFGCAVAAPWPLAVRLLAFSLPAAYLLITALAGTCLGYSLLGKSTCPAPRR
jgi:hypothetical protein